MTNLEIVFEGEGSVATSIRTNSLRIDNFRTLEDFINLVLSMIYIVLYGFILYQFAMQMKQRVFDYKKWIKFEIEYLSEVEKRQRHQKKPEYIRILNVIFNAFTFINFWYSILTFISIIKYIVFTMHCRRTIKTYPLWPDLQADFEKVANEVRQQDIRLLFDDFSLLLAELYDYEIYVVLSILCATLKLFEYFDNSKNMHAMINVLSQSLSDLCNLLIIFLFIMFGFLALSHLSFGYQIKEFSTLSLSFICIYEIAMNNLQVTYWFLDRSTEISMLITIIMFFLGSALFSLVFKNIFLAIMQTSYELNIGQFTDTSTSKNNKNKSEELSLIQSLLYCTIPKEGTSYSDNREMVYKADN